MEYTRPGKPTYKAIEHGPVEIVDFPINSMVIFHCKMLVYQRVMVVLPGEKK